MQLGKVGIWTSQLDSQPSAKAREVVAELEELGLTTQTGPEAVRHLPFTELRRKVAELGRPGP